MAVGILRIDKNNLLNMRYCFFLVLQIVGSSLLAQLKIAQSKPFIDTNSLCQWTSVEGGGVSSKGDYVVYEIRNEPLGLGTLVFRSARTSWERRIVHAGNPVFLDHSNNLIFEKGEDSLCILQLGSDQSQWITGIDQYQVVGHGDLQSLIYSLKTDQRKLIVRNFLSGTEKVFFNIDAFNAFDNNKTIFLKETVRNGPDVLQSLSGLDLNSNIITPIWSSTDSDFKLDLNSIVYDTSRAQLAFEVAYKGRNSLWYCQYGLARAIKLIDRYSSNVIEMDIGNIVAPGFSKDGMQIFFRVLSSLDPLPEKKSADVDIWSYKDDKIQSQQLWEIQQRGPMGFKNDQLAVVNISNQKIQRLNFGNESIRLFRGQSDDFSFTEHLHSVFDLRHKRMTGFDDSLMSIKLSKRSEITLGSPVASYAGKFLLGLTNAGRFYSVYDLSSCKTYNISFTFPRGCRFDSEADELGPEHTGLSLAGWMADDSAIIMYDKYDLWKVDPVGRRPAVNLTRYYGRNHHIILRLIGNYGFDGIISSRVIYILSAFNEETKEQGFFNFSFGKGFRLKFLSMGPYHYEDPYLPTSGWLEWVDSGSYLVKRESASQSPNYYITKDFKDFQAISGVYPELKFNWLTSEVVHWLEPDGKRLAGIVYKPENFDPAKKYPVIVNYYEKVSQYANEYLTPGLASDNINIPWFVSRGYIVFRPDITYRIGEPGRSACNAVVSGTEHLMQYQWINRRKIGVQGHSWGGFETDYIVAHSDLYAAALSAAGVSDCVSYYGSISPSGSPRQYFTEIGQHRMGFSFWERPDLYVENSAVFRADKINTPLLMVNNKLDAAVPFAQGVELFLALWRLGKEAWLLQYDGEGHSLVDRRNELDYTIRMTQFFDHFLRDTPSPKWMSVGVPARLKGSESGLGFP
jgi:dienelactone hydrolase